VAQFIIPYSSTSPSEDIAEKKTVLKTLRLRALVAQFIIPCSSTSPPEDIAEKKKKSSRLSAFVAKIIIPCSSFLVHHSLFLIPCPSTSPPEDIAEKKKGSLFLFCIFRIIHSCVTFSNHSAESILIPQILKIWLVGYKAITEAIQLIFFRYF
jgi:hypothetical protein